MSQIERGPVEGAQLCKLCPKNHDDDQCLTTRFAVWPKELSDVQAPAAELLYCLPSTLMLTRESTYHIEELFNLVVMPSQIYLHPPTNLLQVGPIMNGDVDDHHMLKILGRQHIQPSNNIIFSASASCTHLIIPKSTFS
jgi:hypothetical protein